MTLKIRSKLFLAAFTVGALSALAVSLLLNMWLRHLTVERIEQTLGAAWTGEARMAWASAYAALAGLMKEAAATCFWGRCL